MSPSFIFQTPVYVYYESLCPDSQAFVTKQLYPAMKMLKDHVQLHLIPFGKSTVSEPASSEDNPLWKSYKVKITKTFHSITNSSPLRALMLISSVIMDQTKWVIPPILSSTRYCSDDDDECEIYPKLNLPFTVLRQQDPSLCHWAHPGGQLPTWAHSRDSHRWVHQLSDDRWLPRAALFDLCRELRHQDNGEEVRLDFEVRQRHRRQPTSATNGRDDI